MVATQCGNLTFLVLSILNVGLENTLHLSCLFWLLHNGYLGVHCQKRFWGHGQVLKATMAVSECYPSMSQGEGAGGLCREEEHSLYAENQTLGNIPQHLPPVLT